MSFNVLAEGLHHEDHYHLRHSTSHEVPRGDDDEEEGGSHREDLSILIRKAVREERKRDKFRERKRCVRERDCARPRDEGLRGRTSPPIPRPHSPELTHPLPSSTYPPHPKPTEKAELPGRLRPPRRLRRSLGGFFCSPCPSTSLGSRRATGATQGQRSTKVTPAPADNGEKSFRSGDDNESRSGLEED